METAQQQSTPAAKTVWERGKDALERILNHVDIKDVETLAAWVEVPENRPMLKAFLSTLK